MPKGPWQHPLRSPGRAAPTAGTTAARQRLGRLAPQRQEGSRYSHAELRAGHAARTRDLLLRSSRHGRHFDAVSYDDRVATSSVRPVLLRDGASIEDPLGVVLGFLKMPGRFDVSDPSRPESFGEPDLRLANRGGARISAAQIAAILQRRRAIERALQAIPSAASLSGAVNSVPWRPLSQLFDAFADIRGSACRR